MQLRHGIDIVDIRRLKQSIDKHGRRFLSRIFSPQEQTYCESKRMKYEHYAARFAAKEAFIKAASIPEAHQFKVSRIEVKHRKTGKPYLAFSPATRKMFQIPRTWQIELSLAHEREIAIATVMIWIP